MTPHTHPMPSVRGRLTVWALGISVFFALITALTVWFVLEHEMDEMMDQELREAGELIYHLTADRPLSLLNKPHPPRTSDYEEHLVWQIVDTTSNTVLARSHKAPDLPLTSVASDQVIAIQSGQWHATTFRMTVSGSQLLIVAQSDEERIEAKSEAVMYALTSSTLSALIVSLLLNWRIRKELDPLNQLSNELRGIDPMRLASNVPHSNRKELKPIEEALSELGQRLTKRIASEQAFVAHASHALRTPVAGIDAQLANAIRDAEEPVRSRLLRARESTQRLRYVMQALLGLFRSGMEIRPQQKAFEQFLRDLGLDSIELQVTPNAPALTADLDLMAAVLFNLIDNSRKFGASVVKLTLKSDRARFTLALLDNGTGCTPQACDQLNQALADQDYTQENGLTGLGLVLADLVMRSHQGRAYVMKVNGGFGVELNWPIPKQTAASFLPKSKSVDPDGNHRAI